MDKFAFSPLYFLVISLIQLAATRATQNKSYWVLGALPFFALEFGFRILGLFEYFKNTESALILIFVAAGEFAYQLICGLLLAFNRKSVIPTLLVCFAYWTVWDLYEYHRDSIEQIPLFMWAISLSVCLPLAAFTVFDNRMAKSGMDSPQNYFH